MNRKLKFESTIDISDEVINKNFHKCKLKIMHDGMNANGSIVPLSAIEDAKESIKNTPIMAFVKKDEDGNPIEFGGHESELQLRSKDGELYFKEIFNQVPIGVIPETNNVVIEEIDGKNYLICDGFIWKTYSNDAYDLLLENGTTDVSCEMSCKIIEFDDDDIMHINKFEFLGLVVIDIPPGMEGACIDMNADFSLDNNKEVFTNNLKEINNYLKMQLENRDKESNLTLKNKDTKKDTKMEFGLSIENLRQSINSQLQDITTTRTDYWGDTYECRCYWLETILPEEKIVILEDYNDWNKHYGVKYSMDGDNVVLDFESKAEYIQEWRVKQGTEEVITFEKEDPLKDIILEKFAKKEVEIEKLQKEITKLEEIKLNYEKEVELEKLTNEIEEVISKFSFAEEEILDLKNKALNSEIDIETFEEKLFALEGRKSFAKKTKFSKEEDKKVKIGVKSLEKEETDETIVALNELKAKFCLMK